MEVLLHLMIPILFATASAGGVRPPKDAVALEVNDVTPTADGHLLFLAHPEQAAIVPVMVRESEALTIAYRLAKRPRDRPDTHDLLDQTVRSLGAEVVQVFIHSVEDGNYHARITLRLEERPRKLMHLDARASDAAALALGHQLPVYMANEVYEQARFSDETVSRLAGRKH